MTAITSAIIGPGPVINCSTILGEPAAGAAACAQAVPSNNINNYSSIVKTFREKILA
jgi:hypothetical protein